MTWLLTVHIYRAASIILQQYFDFEKIDLGTEISEPIVDTLLRSSEDNISSCIFYCDASIMETECVAI